MQNSPGRHDGQGGDSSGIRRKLLLRMGVAGLMIVGLLAVLAFFDYLTARKTEPELTPPQFAEPVPVKRKSATQPLTSSMAPEDTQSGEEKKSVAEASAAPSDKSVSPVIPRPAGRSTQQALTRPAASPASLPRTGESAGGATGKVGEGREQAVAAMPAQSGRVPARQVLPPLATGYALQAGVFADVRRAEELHARLAMDGIPSTLEARVQVGPFASREEAEATRAKLQAMGIESVIQPPKGRKK